MSKRALLLLTMAIALLCLIAGSSGAVTGGTTRVSVDDSGTQANGYSTDPSISADGRFVAFTSDASNLVGSDTNSGADVFVRDRKAGKTQRVSVSGSGSQADGGNVGGDISFCGGYMAFHSSATDLVEDDTNVFWDVFVHERNTTQPYDCVAPSGTVVIDDGKRRTTDRLVTLRLDATDPAFGSGVSSMRVKNEGAAWTAWQDYATSGNWKLTPGADKKTVFVQYRDRLENVSAATSDSITFRR